MVESYAPSGFDPVATARWVECLARFAAGTRTVVAFSAAEGVSESNFYLWRWRPGRDISSSREAAGRVIIPA